MQLVYFHRIGMVKDITVGSASHVVEFTEAMKKLGHEVTIHPPLEYDIANNSARLKFLGAKLKQRIIYWIEEFRSILSNISIFFESKKFLERTPPDIIIIRYQLYHFATMVLARLKRVPAILEINAPMAFESRKFSKVYFQLPFLAEWTEYLSLKLANAIITVSEELKEFYVRKGILSEKIFVVPNGANIEKFSPLSGNNVAPDIKQTKNLVIGFIGTFNKWHGINTLGETIWKCSKLETRTKFLLIGDGPLKPDLEKYINDHDLQNFVQFSGIVPHNQIPQYISAMDIVIAPYPKLDFFYFSPLKIFEYMSSAKAIIAARIGQVEELIQDGINGFLYEPDNQDELMSKLLMLVDDRSLRHKFGERARQTILKNYTWDRNAEKISKICVTMLNGR